MRRKQRYLSREARRRERLSAESVKAILATAGDVQTAALNLSTVLKHQLGPSLMHQQEVLQAFALETYLMNGRR